MPARRSKTPAKKSKSNDVVSSSSSSPILEELYTDPEKADDSLQVIDQSGSRRWQRPLLVSVSVLFLLAAAAIAGFFTFNRTQRFDERGVHVTFETASTVASAGETSITVSVENKESVAIRNVELTVVSPDGWTFSSSSPDPADGGQTLWQLGTIQAGRSAAVTLRGSLVGELGAVKTFNATAVYRPANFSSNFTVRSSGSVTIGSSILELQLDGPTTLSPGANATYTLSYRNASAEALENVHLDAGYPDGMTVKETKPKPRTGNTGWVFDRLEAGAEGTITVTGTFSGEVGSSHELALVGSLQRGPALDKQVETSLVILLVDSSLTLSVTVNGQETPPVVGPGETLSYEVRYQNDSQLAFERISIHASLSGGGLNASSFADDYGTKLTDGVAVWSPASVPDLASITPGGSGTIRFQVQVLDAPVATKGASGPTISVGAKVTVPTTAGGNQNSSGQSRTLTTLKPVIVQIRSRATLNVDPRYYDDEGELVGSGPLPPQVGQATRYRVFWYVGNTTNQLTEMTVSAKVPSTIFWTGQAVTTSAGSLSFDSATRTVRWTLNRVPDGVGTTSPTLAASFDLSITPGSSDVGLFPVLLEATRLAAIDGFTKTELSVEQAAVTTNLPNDTRATGKGAVIE